MLGSTLVNAIVDSEVPDQGSDVFLNFEVAQTRVYRDGWIATEQVKAK